MANTYHQMYIQTVFPVKYRKALIQDEWKQNLFAVIGNHINQNGCKTILVNGVSDHIHCFFGLKPSISVSELMKSVKANSSKWVNDTRNLPHRFEWQKGFGCFSYSHSDVERVFRYVKTQEKRHKKMTFREEYLKLLDHFDIKYDERYLFHDPE